MKNKKMKKVSFLIGCMIMGITLTGCSGNLISDISSAINSSSGTTSSSDSSGSSDSSTSDSSNSSSSTATNTMLDTTDIFTDRDLEQEADLTDAQTITLVSDEDITISEAGVYVISGTATNVTILVEAGEDDKVQIVLDSASITNETAPAIYVKEADKVFVTTTDSENTLEVTGTFTADGDTNLDAVIFSKSDLVLNGTGSLTVTCAEGNGITSKDDMKVTGGTYTITAAKDGLEANDSISICDGTFTIDSGKDALHSENEDDLSLGTVYISGGTFTITAADDGIQGTSIVQIDGGTIDIETAVEGIEGTYVIINDGTITIYATDDGINAANKSTFYDVVIELNGGNITITMASGDTDAVDANGCIYVNGGIIDITAPTSSFDFDDSAELNGGTVTVNGEEITEITESQMGGGMGGGPGMGGGGKGGMSGM